MAQLDRYRPGRLRVLVLEDDALTRLATLGLLESLGHEARGCATEEEALELVELGHEPQLALIDVGLPGIGGVAVAQALSARHPALQIVLATGHAEQRGSPWPVLEKPYTDGQVRSILKRAAAA